MDRQRIIGIAPSVSRRRFLQAAAVGTGAVAFSGCAGPNAFRNESRARLAEDDVSANEAWYATACAQCDAGCGTLVRIVDGRARKIEGNPDHPVNRGKLCARGQAALQAEYNPDRLRGPAGRNGARGALPASGLSWDEALRTLAQRLDGARGQVAIVSRPLRGHQALLLQRFAAGLNAQWLRLDTVNEAPFRTAVKQVFGQDAVPEFDLANAGYVLNFGADLLGDWLSPVHYSVAYGQFRQGSYRAGDFHPQSRPRGHLVHVEPRFSGTAAAADEWLPVKPGMEGLVALSIAQAILGSGAGRGGPGEAFFGGASTLEQYRADQVAGDTGVPAERIRGVADEFMRRGPSLAIGGGPAGAHTNGSQALAAILGLNLLADNAGKPGGVLFNGPGPLSGVPSSTPPSSLSDWARLVQQLQAGAIQVVLVYDANPVYELPARLGFRDALQRAPFVASFAAFPDETAQLADMVLPPNLPLEDWGDVPADPAPGLPVLTVRQPILRPLYDSRGFWDVLLDLGRRLDFGNWPAGSFQDVLRDSARSLPGASGDFERFWTDLRAKGFWAGQAGAGTAGARPAGPGQVGARQTGSGETGGGQTSLDQAAASQASTGESGGGQTGAGQPGASQSETGDTTGSQTGTERAGASAARTGETGGGQAGAGQPGASQSETGDTGGSQTSGGGGGWTPPGFDGAPNEFPLYLQVFPHNSLGQGEAANLPWMQALPDPITTVVWRTWVEVSPKLGFKEGDLVRVETPQGSAELPVYVSPAAPPDVISIPLGQGHTAYGRYAEKRGANPLDLVAPLTDAGSGALAYGATRARVVATGRRIQLPKYEGDVPAYQIPGKEVLEVRYGGK